MIENIIREYATSGEEPKFYKPLSSKTKLDLDQKIKHYSEVEHFIDETLTKIGIIYPAIKEITNLNVVDAYSYEQLKKEHKATSKWAFTIRGLLYKRRYGKWHNSFVKENPLKIVFLSTMHEIGHVVYYCLNLNKISDKEIEEAFAISFHLYGLETFNALDYAQRFIIGPLKEDIKRADDNELGIKTLKGIIDQFPTMKELALFLKYSTKEEILEKAGLKKF